MNIIDPSRREIWQRFVREGILDHARMNKRIAESWHLCRQKNVDPYDGKGKIILESHLLREIIGAWHHSIKVPLHRNPPLSQKLSLSAFI